MKKAVFAVIAVLLLTITITSADNISADGMIIPSKPIYQINETGQKAVIWYKDGKETLILSTTFKGNADEFVWVIPVPTKPEVEKSKDELYTALNDYTQPPSPTYNSSPFLGGVNLGSGRIYSPTVTVHETKRVDIYDIAVLESSNADALRNWLTENGYEYPENKKHLLDHYIQKKWFFVAAKINTQALGYAGSALKEGHATPLSVTFASPTIIYPLKISGKGEEDAQSKKIAAYSFETGTQDWTAGRSSTPASQGTTTSSNYPMITFAESYEGRYSLLMADDKLTNSTARSPASLTRQLKTGKNYVLSGYLKVKNHTTATIYVSASNTTDKTMLVNNLKEFSEWKRFEYPFSYRSGSNLLIYIVNGSEETIYLDAVQIDEGNKASEFTTELIPDTTSSTSVESDSPVGIVLYVFADKKQDVPGFTVEFADHMSEKSLEKLSIDENGKPWIDAKGRSYLTKLTRTVKPSQMVDDLVLREADDQKDVNGRLTGLPWWSSILLFLLVASEVAVAGYFLRRYSNRKA